MPKITVLTITTRNLYLSEQVNSLKSQTLQDFEWVVVDSHCAERPLILAHLIKGAFSFTHIPDKKPDYYATSQAFNTGLIYSRGELVFFMSDYILPHPDCLARHWEIYKRYKNVMISGRSIRMDCSPLELDTMLNSMGGNIMGKDYRAGIKQDRTLLEPDLYEVKPTTSLTWWSGRNDSAPLEAMLDCNGFEEEMDGGWGGQDGEFANRLMTYGLRHLLDRKSMCLKFEHTPGQGKSIRTAEEQLALGISLVKSKKESGVYTSNLKRSLREERKKTIG